MPPPPKTPPPKNKIKKSRNDRLTVYLFAIYAPLRLGAAFFVFTVIFRTIILFGGERVAPLLTRPRAADLVIFMRFSAKTT